MSQNLLKRSQHSCLKGKVLDSAPEMKILQGGAKSTEPSDDQSYLLVQTANSYCACVGQTEECWLPKIVLSYDLVRYFIHIWIGVAYGKGMILTKKLYQMFKRRLKGWGGKKAF